MRSRSVRPVVLSLAAVVCALGCGKSERTAGTGAPVPTPPTPAVATDAGPGAVVSPPASPVSDKLVAVPPAIAKSVKLHQVARGFARPVAIEFAPGDDSGRLFVVEQAGLIRVLRGSDIDATPFADLRKLVTRRNNEQGLLGLAFHPKFARNGKLYVNYSARNNGATKIVEFRVADGTPTNATAIEPATARELLSIDQPWGNHNGGGIEFGPDGMLYIGMGDGGAANDPLGSGQDDNSLLGKMLKLDVDTAGAKPVVVAKGVRNPWRFDFDEIGKNVFIGDVGQNKWEWVNAVRFDELAGKNFGWNVTEGKHCFQRAGCDRSKFTAPVIEYDHQTGCSITGGEVYRGKALPALAGQYFYADFCTALVRSFRWSKDGVRDHWDWKPVLDPRYRLATISSFGSDKGGELYMVSLDGPVYKIVPAAGP